MLRRSFRLAVLSLMLVAACGGTRPPATSPMATSGVVGGTVRVAAVLGAPLQPILVSVGRTTQSASVSRLGDFALANVPAGPLELRFTGDGIAAVLPAGEIAGGETVTFSIRLMPAQAVIESMSRIRGTAALVEGAIETPGVTLPDGTIIVGGRTITIPAGLSIKGSPGASVSALRPGVRVRITGAASAAGVTAHDIVIL